MDVPVDEFPSVSGGDRNWGLLTFKVVGGPFFSRVEAFPSVEREELIVVELVGGDGHGLIWVSLSDAFDQSGEEPGFFLFPEDGVGLTRVGHSVTEH